ncbi:endonuclease Q family protein [Bacillus alkalicellulosilyticus]|uniref:endonuclease Q family protein n=1 Tax=Alkalihalobacterium alkalicellulosilyticum TaxID=1912214 RepID=UPI000998C14F|nr:endonuclease Q family protein [Bacillus alkalicellulosilyticus]
MRQLFADLHIHIGRTASYRPVKITAANTLTLSNIISYASSVKGIDLIGVIDCHVPEVIDEIEAKIIAREAYEHEEGGIFFQEGITLFLGSEIEIYDDNCKGPIHVLAFLPTIKAMKDFSMWLQERLKNVTLSSQRIYENGKVFQEKVKDLGGLFIPAHVFTPFKSLYGKGVTQSVSEVFNPDLIDAIELGLSSDTTMAEQIDELVKYPFLTNSDAHSLEKIAREYQMIEVQEPTFSELKKALKGIDGRKIISNFGLNPKLGKYYFTSCEKCYEPKKDGDSCLGCGHKKFTKGVYQRLLELRGEATRPKRPPYIHQIPLEFIPKLGPKTLEKLRDHFGTDMAIIHEATEEQLQTVVTPSLAEYIIKARTGQLHFQVGGAGKYGKVT